MNRHEKITFMIIPENHKESFSYSLSRFSVWVISGIFSIIFVIFLIGVFLGGRYLDIYFENRAISKENNFLRDQLEKVRLLEERLAMIEESEIYLRRFIGIDQDDGRDNMKEDISAVVPDNFISSIDLDSPQKRTRFIPRGLPQSGALTVQHGSDQSIFSKPHLGVDISLPAGKPVFSTAAGIVVFSGYDKDTGLTVKIDHLNGYTTLYGHLSRISSFKGQALDRNAIVGFSGNTGNSMGTHIHYMLMKDGKPIDPLNNSSEEK